VEVHREGAFHPGARLHLCAGHAVEVARLQCDERLNRMALRALYNRLVADAVQGAIVIHAAHKFDRNQCLTATVS
jgi:hypothetical protein